MWAAFSQQMSLFSYYHIHKFATVFPHFSVMSIVDLILLCNDKLGQIFSLLVLWVFLLPKV